MFPASFAFKPNLRIRLPDVIWDERGDIVALAFYQSWKRQEREVRRLRETLRARGDREAGAKRLLDPLAIFN